jgi:hypothetical protein
MVGNGKASNNARVGWVEGLDYSNSSRHLFGVQHPWTHLAVFRNRRCIFQGNYLQPSALSRTHVGTQTLLCCGTNIGLLDYFPLCKIDFFVRCMVLALEIFKPREVFTLH